MGYCVLGLDRLIGAVDGAAAGIDSIILGMSELGHNTATACAVSCCFECRLRKEVVDIFERRIIQNGAAIRTDQTLLGASQGFLDDLVEDLVRHGEQSGFNVSREQW